VHDRKDVEDLTLARRVPELRGILGLPPRLAGAPRAFPTPADPCKLVAR
jgi:hypothetical protein